MPTEGGRLGETPQDSQAPAKAPRRRVLGRRSAESRASSTPWDAGAMMGLPRGTVQYHGGSSDSEDLAGAQRHVGWDDVHQNVKREDSSAQDRSYRRAEQRWKYVRLLRETGLRFSGANDEMGAETFLS
uniref:Uncharacterized protein n=1 Tax=Trichogramma kaykai TaxID=54128 RepID=A0ABD2XQC0_9HYME